MGDFQEVDDTINKLVIAQVKERPSIYYTDTYTESDELHWNEIQKNTGIQS